MPYGMYMSAAGAKAQSHRLEVVSHNLANVNTPGYKAQAPVLQARFAESIEESLKNPGTGEVDDVGGGVTLQSTGTEFREGPIKQTGVRTDFAIHNASDFFVVQHDDQQMLTRAGNFLFNSNGTLVNQGGDPVLDTGGRPIQIDPRLPFDVTAGGRITQSGTTFDLMLARPNGYGDLSRQGENLYMPLAEFQPVAPTEREVANGALEQSAVNPTTTMMELIEASRGYEANTKMIQNQDHVMGSLISRILQS
ncbi:Flagellar basal-body rod protein FlgG [Rosistilla oblonga]|uniref:Flagellar basal-body rod protein FlgG n=2 Tax=Rosistilla TaxID=2795779 RepID=A0A518IQI1_9BACT|nr:MULTISPECIES: flagellar hook basal-body protein [Rosistilla]QDS87202.1 Flagellar basal-body rod protein FlgG [Rosistilla ulvae]QDV11374.1 Flagellar basal-body rod protein FlgG [Rosistilla oblonga]QDV55320.1 Flagellar basal-body rod protein FlgG [Rosistilla oblonga]